MLKKLTEEKLEQILEAGISEFAEYGLQKASMNAIAQRAGISVGVLYKYYENKDAFFDACVERCMASLNQFLQQLCAQKKKPLDYAQEFVNEVQQFSSRHRDHIRLYFEATRTADPEQAAKLAHKLEQIRAQLYIKIISQAQASGDVRSDLDPRMFAFFFDNLLITMQLSYCCPYYRERLKLYADRDTPDDSHIASQLLKFLESAFTLEQADIPHRETKGEIL